MATLNGSGLLRSNLYVLLLCISDILVDITGKSSLITGFSVTCMISLKFIAVTYGWALSMSREWPNLGLLTVNCGGPLAAEIEQTLNHIWSTGFYFHAGSLHATMNQRMNQLLSSRRWMNRPIQSMNHTPVHWVFDSLKM